MMGVMIEEILKPTSLSNTSQRVTQRMTIAMTRCEIRQTPRHQLKCCGDQTVQTSIVTGRGTVKRKRSTFTGPVRETTVSVLLHKKTPITLPVLTLIQTELQRRPVIQQMTGQSISVHPEKNTIIIAEQRSLSGRNLKNGWRESRGREKVPRRWLTAFPKTEIIDKKRCRPVPQVPSVVQNPL